MKLLFFLSIVWTWVSYLWHNTDMRKDLITDKRLNTKLFNLADKLLPNPIICLMVDVALLLIVLL